jgi:hypothetical protein
MPNKRHPAKKYIGFWGTESLKKRLLEKATGSKESLSRVITAFLWSSLTGQRKADRPPPPQAPRSNKKKR